MESVPYPNTKILCRSSLAMAIPIYYSRDFLFSVCLMFTLMFSFLHWKYYRMGSWYQTLDRCFSCLTLVILSIYSPSILPLIPVVLTFGVGHYYRRQNKFGKHLMFHLLFRMFAFLWCCQYCQHTNVVRLLTYVLLYVVYIGCELLIHARQHSQNIEMDKNIPIPQTFSNCV